MKPLHQNEIKNIKSTSYINIYLIEVLLKSDARYASIKSQKGVRLEMEGQLERNAFEFVGIKQIAPNSHKLGKVITAINI